MLGVQVQSGKLLEKTSSYFIHVFFAKELRWTCGKGCCNMDTLACMCSQFQGDYEL